ncbi:sugar transporter [Marinisporobacter balticus]|uniref:Sugar transporter n=1 Tax=Marinisporobacter balticus TaxID=2018667 RepID=A0A4R2KPQ1_9FIRM|nr:sugar transporter [Marinisporobacter balticus]TCO74742.1 hypothetical protein EV214_1114 [Marinisporobacter balticus]
MSMSAEHAEELKNEIAAVCCRTEEGTILSAANLEDPNIFPDLEASGLMNIPENCLKIGQVIGAKLVKTIDSLTPLTADLLEGIKELKEEAVEEQKDEENMVIEKDQAQQECMHMQNGTIKINIEEGKGIYIELEI